MTEAEVAAKKAADEAAAAEAAKGKENPSVDELLKQVAELNRENAERRTTNRGLQESLDSIKADQEAAKQKAAEKNGEFEELYKTTSAEATSFKEKTEKLQKVVDGYLEKEIEKVPEDKRDAIPDLPAEQKLAWLQTHGHTLLGSKVIPGPKAKEAGKEDGTSLEEQHAKASDSGNISLALSLKRQIGERDKQITSATQ